MPFKKYITLTPLAHKLQNTRNGFVLDNAVAIVILAMCSNMYLAGLLRYMGFSSELNGIVSAIPVVGAVFQILGPIAMERAKNKRLFIVSGIAISRILMAAIFTFPLLFGKSTLGGVMVVVVFAIGNLAGAAVTPASANWIMSVTPENIRAGFFDLRERIGLIGTALISVAVSAILDHFDSPTTSQYGFFITGVILLIFALIDTFVVFKIYMPQSTPAKGIDLSSLKEVFHNFDTIKVMVLLILWQLTQWIWIPYNNVYMLDYLKISYTTIGILGVISSVVKIGAVYFWCKFASKKSWEHTLFYAVVFYFINLVIWQFITPQNAYWIIWPQQIYTALPWSIVNVAMFNVMYQNIKHEQKVLHIGVVGGVSGLLGFAFTLSGSFMLKVVNGVKNPPRDGVQVLMLIAAVIALLMLAYLYIFFLPPPKPGEKQSKWPLPKLFTEKSRSYRP